jgi:hypothetical protein
MKAELVMPQDSYIRPLEMKICERERERERNMVSKK